MWTFQEFVLARRAVLVVGHVKILWEDFRNVISILTATPSQPAGTSKQNRMRAKKHAVIRQLLPPGVEGSAELEAATHMFPTWLEVMDALMCRRAYQERLQSERVPVFMSYFLHKSRNRDAKDPKDKIYGLYYLFGVSGFDLPPIDYRQTVAEVYTSVALALLRKSNSWWILSHLFNKRGTSAIQMPSWVPDFSSHTVWHQGADLRFQNLNELEVAIEREEDQASLRTNKPFKLEEVEGGLLIEAVFLWTVKKVAPEMPSNPILDRCFEEEFEQTDFQVIQDALEEFMFTLASLGDVNGACEQLAGSSRVCQECNRAGRRRYILSRVTGRKGDRMCILAWLVEPPPFSRNEAREESRALGRSGSCRDA